MTLFWWLIVATLVVAVADWWAVATDRRPVEYVLKPATMVVLIAAALTIGDPVADGARWFLVVGLVFSLAGDVFLMLDELVLDQKGFIPGLVSFLLGHVAYVVALAQFPLTPAAGAVAAVFVVGGAGTIGVRVVRGAAGRDARLKLPVAAYLTVISAMVVVAGATAVPFAIAGAVSFYASDGLLGWNKFVDPIPGGRIGVMVTYHLGQVGLVLGLLG